MTVIDVIRANAARFADRPALMEGDQTWTHAEMWSRVDALSRAFHDLGLTRGDVVMAWLPNCHELLEAELAALQSGVVWVSINARFTWAEAAEAIADCSPALLITDPERLARARAALDAEALATAPEPDRADAHPIPTPPSRLPRVMLARADSTTADAALIGYEEAIAKTGRGAERPSHFNGSADIPESTLARLRYTSGATGRPKAAMVPHRVYLASLRNLQAELHPLGPDDRALHAAPLTHATGAIIFPILAAGGANVLLDKFDPSEALDVIERLKITTTWLAPTMLQRLGAAPDFQTRDLSSLRTVMYGGAPMAVEKIEPLIDKLGHALVQIFGMTEAPFPITTLRREHHIHGGPKLGSIGKPTAICELRLIDENGRDLPDGLEEFGGGTGVGELLVRGPNVMDGYWRDEAETRAALRDGWLHSGDLARRDADGYYWIVDRRKDVIISGGFNVYAREVEAALLSHADIEEAAVVGRPHPDWGEEVVACVVARTGSALRADDLDRWLRERLAPYKRPKRIEFMQALPRTASGKLVKRALVNPGA